ncbi:MAG TPA: glycosyltransferase [Gemmatales bacterium]|nr:glycosyltransferase [Gemmatales bacterium]HMP16072.1 glycosyltransferase [Gemmatales bacterium]
MQLRVALIHDWLITHRGGEKVFSAISEIFPKADIFTLFVDKNNFIPLLTKRRCYTSWMQRLPRVKHYYRFLLPWMPAAIESFQLRDYDLIISSSHCVAKGVRVPKGIPHICYCHTPMRYAWNLQELYLQHVPRVLRSLVKSQLLKLKDWDRNSNQGVTQFVANGKTVQQRIKNAYDRDSFIVHPPVDVNFYCPDKDTRRESYYLVVSALVPNKRIDLAIKACIALDKKLVIIGTGSELSRLKIIASSGIHFLGWTENETIRYHLRRCAALLFPGEEDFGIVPLEANACGCPVIAYGRSGATETIHPLGTASEPTGVWFQEATAESLIEAIQKFESYRHVILPENCRKNALPYSYNAFYHQFHKICIRTLNNDRCA